MTTASPAPALHHEALFYDSDQRLASAAVAFVRQGLERGERVLVNTHPLSVTPLLRAVFADEPGVELADDRVYTRPVAVLDRYRRLLDRALRSGAPGVRAVGHLDLAGGALPWQEWVRYEAAVNRFLAGYPLRTLCPYDLRATAPEQLQGMRRAHPWHLVDGHPEPAPGYVEPDVLAALPEYAAGPDALEHTAPTLQLDDVTDLRALRLDVYPALLPTDLAAKQVDDFVKAVTEVAANALAHGRPPVRVRLWAAPRKLVCTVHDHGPGPDDPLLGYARPAPGAGTGPGGLGVWAARQLCDLLDYRTGPDGCTARLLSAATGVPEEPADTMPG